MALPKLLQKLFQNNGVGPKLREDIIPIDTALSTTSTNAVQNKVIKSALDGKLSTSGGTVNGTITLDGGNYRGLVRGSLVRDFEIKGANNDGSFTLCPGDSGSYASKKSATLFLTSTDYTGNLIAEGGAFRLNAMDAATGVKSLSGATNGSLTWCNHNVITVVAESYSANSWYRKYSDGWIEQGLVFTSTGSKNWATPFTSSPYTVLASSTINPTVSSTSITVSDMNYGPQSKQSKIYVYACGK